MSVNYEIKSQLAKLLATEDLVVENKNVSTASFDVLNRVLTLPMWRRASDVVYDMLVGHEVGHALHTPSEDWDFNIPKQFLNVTEDVRVEKLMKRRYAGLNKTFYNGYKELAEEDFFCIEDEDISEMNLADRINLYYKIGNFIDVPFTEEELVVRQQVEEAETFIQAVDAARVLYSHCKESQKTDRTEEPELTITTPEESEEGKSDEKKEQERIEKEIAEDTEGEQEADLDTPSYEKSRDQPFPDPEVSTDTTFEQGMESLNSDIEGRENIYVEHPDFKMEDVVADVTEVQEVLNTWWVKQEEENDKVFEAVDYRYNKFKKSSQREVNFLVKEFEMKKAADAYSRSSIAKTGTLDCTKLHTYKFNEDLFKKVSVIPDGKSHGLIFILDWSGSMGNIMEDTVKQMYSLIWFCQKVNIPFEVYAFSNYFQTQEYDDHHKFIQKNTLYISQDFCLMNVLSSRVKKSELDQHMKNFFRVVSGIKNYYNYRSPGSFCLGGTPLYESFVSLHKIIPHFQKIHKVQKIQCVILTDGDGHPIPVSLERIDYYNRTHVRPSYGRNVYLRNRKTGHTHYMDQTSSVRTTDVFLKDLRQTFPHTNFVGIRISEPRNFSRYISSYEFKTEEQLKKIRKDKSFNILNSQYHALFAIISNSLNNDTTFEVKEDASKYQIRSAFTKSLRGKALNKKVLTKFIDVIS
jgi:hypothetical protein